MQIAVRAGGFSALVVVGMAVIGIAILYSTFYVWLGVDSPGAMSVNDRKSSVLFVMKVNYIFISSAYAIHHRTDLKRLFLFFQRIIFSDIVLIMLGPVLSSQPYILNQKRCHILIAESCMFSMIYWLVRFIG